MTQPPLRVRHDRVMGDGAPLFYDEPIELVRGEGVWVEDVTGRRFLDMYNNVPCVGHANAHVANAISDQMSTLNVHSRYLHHNVIAYGERLLALHHDGIESMIMTCSGSESLELALRMARHCTGRRGLIATDATYHGNTALVRRTSRLPVGTDSDGVKSIATPQMFRPVESGLSEAGLLQRHLDQLEATIASFDDEGGFAGLLLCTILANEGLPTPPTGWFEAAIGIVHDAGGVVIGDEVQAGFGRTGSWWGYEALGFEPDIVCMGKPMGNGMPVAAVAASHDAVSQFRHDNPYFNTYAASPIQAAAANAVIDEIEHRDLLRSVSTVGASVRTALEDLSETHPAMGDVRGLGLFLGVDWVHPGTTDPDVDGAHAVVEALLARGMLVGRAGQHRNVVKIRPPLVFEQQHADLFMASFAEMLRDRK